MQGQRGIFLLIYTVAVAIHVSLSFNIEITNPRVYNGEKEDFFGYKVHQFNSGAKKGIIVTAPLHQNGTGAVCKYSQNQPEQCVSPTDLSLRNKIIPVKHFGLTIAARSNSAQFTVCTPSIAHECYENSYLNSACYNMTDDFQLVPPFTPAFQECTKKTVDLIFLFDGSGSMTEAEFNKNKDFIVDIINSLKNSSIKFAAVQFSTDYKKVFDFNDYEAGTSIDKLMAEPHMKGLTNTHKALTFVLDHLFESRGAGASPDATKVLVIITDGDPSDLDRRNIVQRYDEKNIIRFVIGVKVATMEKFKTISSQPTEKYAFKIENYDGLTGILENFQKKIFTMEGSKAARAGNWTNEMSQSGFSAVFHKDTLILGSVGSNSWRGSLREIQGSKETEIDDPDIEKDSYMGYSVSVGEKNNIPLYFAGAPRFEHIGQVILFIYKSMKWTTVQRLNGTQIGSYFGAELCSVDIDSNGNTDFLLVGVPLFYMPQEKTEGQIFVYRLTDEMQLEIELNVTAPAMGRFGTTIASLADLNGDGLRDVAVGAPLEDDSRGAVYIYLGDRNKGIRNYFSQRIVGEKIEPGLRFFGQAIDGDIDLEDDGLPDIVIGSQGKVVVLRSRPVFNVTARLTFQPGEISIEHFKCLGTANDIFHMLNLTTCFEMVETTRSKAGPENAGLNISYTLSIDPMRQIYRGFLSQNDKKARNLTVAYELRQRETCFNYSIYMPECVKDTLSPLCFKLLFSQADSNTESGVLSVDSKRQAVVEIPFEKQCSNNNTCIADLVVDLNVTSSELLVAEDKFLEMFIKLSNPGDDSYNTSLTMHYPPGLSFSMMTLEEKSRPVSHTCHDLEGVLDKTVCSVSLPVYRSKSHAIFKTSFRIDPEYKWNNTISMTVVGNSDNANSSTNSFMTKTIPVRFEMKLAVTLKDDTINYLNFTSEGFAPKKLHITYQIANLGVNAFPVNVSLIFPTELDYNFEMKNYQVLVEQNKTHCSNIQPSPCSTDNHSKMITCDTVTLDKESVTEFKLAGDVQFRDLGERAANLAFLKRYTGEDGKVKFKSFISINYDKNRFVLDSQIKEKSNDMCLGEESLTKKWSEVRVDFIIEADRQLIILTGVLLGLLILIIITIIMFKLGCFKRRKLPDDEEHSAAYPDEPAPAPVPTQEKVSQSKTEEPSENKILLDDANGKAKSTDSLDLEE
ncbi:Integrin alpha-M CD11 antigen-like family member B [Channa argus]|uniref:Integrin alpha-M CD11 antigen-like family member B n=1 Tax=Channa argus TaxID=215402 RepID=A0A6G1PAV7_CHAAH|nr:Integrin alpha-M CD11 antigen-like family member B [Channa argus]